MQHPDLRGNPCSSASAAARDAAEQALWRMMTFYDVPLPDLDAAAAADPGWVLPALMKAGFLFGLTDPALHAEATAALTAAQARVREATPRERAHLHAVQALADGRWHAACAVWEALLLEHPRDALALQWLHLWDFHRGDAVGLRRHAARALPDWDEADPLYPHVLALWAFGLEENHLYPQAEEAGRRALALQPRAPWAVHAVAHVMEMEGRFEEGAAWLRAQQPVWAEGNGFAVHLWWHKTLFRIEAMDLHGARRLVDAHLAGDALQVALQRLDAASALWRLWLLGEDVAAACAALVDGWALDDTHAGRSAFNDVHAMAALLGAGELHRAEHWLARCAGHALDAGGAGRSNHAVAREVGVPLMRGLLALARGNGDGACDLIAPLRTPAQRLGGSHAQRDLVDQTLLAAAARGGRRSLGRALVNERRLARAPSPLTRHWQQHFGDAADARA